MVTMNSEKSACRRKPVEKVGSSGSSSKKGSEHVEDAEKKDEECRNESPDLSPNTPTCNITASCAEDTPNYLVYKKVTLAREQRERKRETTLRQHLYLYFVK